MSNLSFRRPNFIIHDQFTSQSGKYEVFLGHHYHTAGNECWIIAAYNIVTGDQTERHYNLIPWPENRQGLKNTCTDPKGEALIAYSKFKEGMLRKPASEETDEYNQWWEQKVKPFLERERKRQGIKKDNTGLVH